MAGANSLRHIELIMKNVFIAFALTLLLILPFQTPAQVQVSFPTTRAVLQRNATNQATIRITGYYTAPLTRVEARLIARDGQGTTTEWQTIQNNATGGTFAGDLTGLGGWYDLKVRGMNSDQPVGTETTVERIGIGEVFVIAGQSNAQGVHQDAPNPQNDRVNCVNYRYPNNGFPNDPPTPVFTRLDNTPGFTIAPRGQGSWCWGQLGDLLVKRLNVPVMFFNAAYDGTAVQNWAQSAPEGGTAYGVYNGDAYQPRQPYINLKIALQFYCNTLGVRSVLWHQGEADNLIQSKQDFYVQQLQIVIKQTRDDFGRNVPWMVARASYGDPPILPGGNPVILAAQNQVIASTANVYAGPNTDLIQTPRNRDPRGVANEGLHFDEAGLVEVASAWNASMTDAFFQQAVPIGPAAAPAISVACATGNNLTLSVNGEFPNIRWESGETGRSITKGAGLYRATIKDALGNTFFSGQVRVSDAPIAAVVDNRPPSICAGNSIALTSNYDNVTWVNQANATVATTRLFSTNTADTYQVRYADVSGCPFVSNALTLRVNPLPATPTVANARPTTFCQGDNTVLQTATDAAQYNWSDGRNAKAISVGAPGNYFLTVTDQNGCTSFASNTIAVTVNPIPDKPTVTANGPLTFCADRNVTLSAPANAGYSWSGGQGTQTITVNQAGNYSVRTRNQFGCASVESDAVTIRVNALPAIPAISALGATTFCEGNRVTLQATSPLDVVWASGQLEKTIIVTTSGNYAVQARDQNGCLSPYSPLIVVRANPLPPTPTIRTSRPPIICEGDRVTLRVDGPYTVFWSTGDSTNSITTGQPGTYLARVRDNNGCVSAQRGAVTVENRPLPPSPTINSIGTYSLQAVSSTNGTEFRWRRGADSLAFDTGVIKANQTGSYTARSSIIYSPTLTCFSPLSAPYQFTLEANNRGLSVYPNPNPNKLVLLETEQNLTNAQVTVYTLLGQLATTFTVPVFDERKQIDLTGLAPGMYVLRVQAAGFDVSKRILLGM